MIWVYLWSLVDCLECWEEPFRNSLHRSYAELWSSNCLTVHIGEWRFWYFAFSFFLDFKAVWFIFWGWLLIKKLSFLLVFSSLKDSYASFDTFELVDFRLRSCLWLRMLVFPIDSSCDEKRPGGFMFWGSTTVLALSEAFEFRFWSFLLSLIWFWIPSSLSACARICSRKCKVSLELET